MMLRDFKGKREYSSQRPDKDSPPVRVRNTLPLHLAVELLGCYAAMGARPAWIAGPKNTGMPHQAASPWVVRTPRLEAAATAR